MVDDAAAACVPFMYPSSSEDTYRDIENYPWVLEYLPSATGETDFLVKYIQSKVTDPTIGIAQNTTASGMAESEAFQASAEKAGLKIVKIVDDTDPVAAATTLKGAGADVVYHAGVVGSCGSFDAARERVDYHPKLSSRRATASTRPSTPPRGRAPTVSSSRSTSRTPPTRPWPRTRMS